MPENGKKKKRYGKKGENFDLLSVTESLGYRTNRKASKNYWSKEDDTKLGELVNEELVRMGLVNGIHDLKSIHDSMHYSRKIRWDNILFAFKNKYRTPKLLRKRWISALDPNIKRGKWTPEEDEKLVKAYEKLGPKWSDISSEILGRTEDQCSKRYIEILGPSSKERLREWTLEEELSLISKVKKYGTKWRTISSEMVNRPSLTCRNRWRRIITLVVRGQAPPKIMEAVKENKDIDLSNVLVKATKNKENDETIEKDEEMDNGANNNEINNNDKTETTTEPFSYPTTYEVSLRSEAQKESTRSSTGFEQTIETDKLQNMEGVTSSTEDGYQFSESYSELNKGTNESSLSVNERIDRDSGALSLFELKHDRRSVRSASPMQAKSLFAPVNDKDEKNTSPTVSARNITSPQSNLDDSRDETPSLEQQFSETKITENTKKSTSSQTQWKFTLKDEQGYSISNGNISNSELVKELIEQAKKNHLKISIHQHIHHHYGGAISQNASTANLNEPLINNIHNKSISEAKGFSLASIGQSPMFDSPGDFKVHFDVGDNAFMNSPNSNPFGLDVDTPASHDYYTKTHEEEESPQREQTASTNDYQGTHTGSSSGSFSTPGSDLHDVGPNRMTHFTFLSSAIRPQLGSSDSTKNVDLQNLLHESNARATKRRRRGTHSHSHKQSQPHTPSNLNTNAHHTEPGSVDNSKPSDNLDESRLKSNAFVVDDDEDEEVDFWESLRSLANNPVSPHPNIVDNSVTDMDINVDIDENDNQNTSYGDLRDNYPMATDSKPIDYIDQFLEHNKGISPSNISEDSESFFLPLNPS